MTVEADDLRGNIARATVDITILRDPDDIPPIFIGTDSDGNYRVGVVYNRTQVGDTVFTAAAFDQDRDVSELLKLVFSCFKAILFKPLSHMPILGSSNFSRK